MRIKILQGNKKNNKNWKFDQGQIPTNQLKKIKGGSGGSGAVILVPSPLL